MFPQFFSDVIFGTTSKTAANSSRRSSRLSSQHDKVLSCSIKLTLEDIYTGKTSKLSLQRHIFCPGCRGTGEAIQDSLVSKTCQSCNGCGVRYFKYKSGSTTKQIDLSCGDCHGVGEHVERTNCAQCVGKKTITKHMFLDAKIAKGVRDKQKITIPLQSLHNCPQQQQEKDEYRDVIPNEIIAVIQEIPHHRFKRLADNLVYEAHIDLVTALSGGQIAIPHLDDRVLLANLSPGEAMRPDCVKVIPNQGMPVYNSHHIQGHMLVKFFVDLPQNEWVTPDIIAQISALLPPAPQVPTFVNKRVENVTLTDSVATKHWEV
ncbi:hypothetical protein J3Q64DRAFT_1750522 [Phycomyces blakesleeanus]